MKVLFTIGYIQYTIGLQLYLLKRSIDKVTGSWIQAIKVSGDAEQWVLVFRKVCQSLKVLHLMHSKEHQRAFDPEFCYWRNWKNNFYIFFHKNLLKMFLPHLRIFWELSSKVPILFAALASCYVAIFESSLVFHAMPTSWEYRSGTKFRSPEPKIIL